MGLHLFNLLGDHPTPPAYSLSDMPLGDLVFRRKIGAGSFGLIYLVEDARGVQYAAKIVFPRVGPTKPDMERQAYRVFSRRPAATKLDLEQLAAGCLYAGRGEFSAPGCQAAAPGCQSAAPGCQAGESGLSQLLQEVRLQLRVHQHPNIATVHDVYSVQDAVVVTVMEYFPHGDLFGAIIDRHMFSQPPPHQHQQLLMKNCMLQLIDAVHHCASHSVYHCDLKPENILVSYNRAYVRRSAEPLDYAELRVSLIDFGLALASDSVCCNVCRGSNFYMAPERIVNFSTSKLARTLLHMERPAGAEVFFPTLAGDVWSLGVLFINVTCARNPWPVANLDDRHDVFCTYVLRDKTVLRAILPISRQFNELLDAVFALDPSRRVSLPALAAMVRACDFFSDPEPASAPALPENSTLSPALPENSTLSPTLPENSTLSPTLPENSTLSPTLSGPPVLDVQTSRRSIPRSRASSACKSQLQIFEPCSRYVS